MHRLFPTSLITEDGELFYIPQFFGASEAAALFQDLRDALIWEEEVIRIAGRPIKVPRLVCWYGDSDACYQYSGVTHEPKPWTDVLLRIKHEIEARTGFSFNSVLGNFYRSGQDSMGWHADKEKELGQDPVIASLSFGATRLFKLRHARRDDILDLPLQDGSLLVMSGCLQHHWRHCVPKCRQHCSARINLTFRRILTQARV